MLPTFIHVGAAKCASTWLWRICQEHPDVYVPTEKATNFSGALTAPDHVNFFVADFDRGMEWYERTYFSGWDGEPAGGEFSNSYMVCEHALERIARALPHVKLTMTVRDPIERAFLQYAHHRRTGLATHEFAETLDLHRWQLFRMYIEPGFYHLHLTRMLRYFPREQIKVLFYRDLVADARAFSNDFFSFIGVSTDADLPTLGATIGFPSPEQPDTSDGVLAKGIEPVMRARLTAIFEEQIQRLEEFTGRDLGSWRTG